jgi:hypothetical protein
MDQEFNSGVVTNSYKWGWNIAYSSGQPLSCEIWAGAADECDLQGGVQVGTFEIDDCSVTWNFFDPYESNDFSFYAGSCEGSDGGAFVPNGGICDTSTIKDNAAAPESYPLLASNDFGAVSNFTFSGCAGGNEDTYLESIPWGLFGYDVFALGGVGRRYLTAHAKVCPVEVDRDVLPTQSPTEAPARPPTRMPTRTPSFGPTTGPTKTPISRPTSSPTTLPDTGAPVSVRSNSPVSSPNSNCATAFVYCPGYSTCFLDDDFNSGRDIVTGNQEDSWGWNIEHICGGTLGRARRIATFKKDGRSDYSSSTSMVQPTNSLTGTSPISLTFTLVSVRATMVVSLSPTVDGVYHQTSLKVLASPKVTHW